VGQQAFGKPRLQFLDVHYNPPRVDPFHLGALPPGKIRPALSPSSTEKSAGNTMHPRSNRNKEAVE